MDMHHYLPSTPPLSAAGSSMSSPLSSNDMLPTPIGEVFLAQGVEGVKEGCEGEVHSEILANIDWSRAGSPPMTPCKSTVISEIPKPYRKRKEEKEKEIKWWK